MHGYPEHLQKLIQLLKKLPGVGSRSAERFAFHFLKWSPQQLQEFSKAFSEIPDRIKNCEECGCLLEIGFVLFAIFHAATLRSFASLHLLAMPFQ